MGCRRRQLCSDLALRIGLGVVLVVSTGGCTAVKPWERGKMARRCMALDPAPESTLIEQHVYQYREGSAGGYGGLGGGCGCN